MWALTISNPLKSSDIFSWNILGLLQNPIGSFWYSHFPHGSKIVQSWFFWVITLYYNTPYLSLMITHAWRIIDLEEYIVFLVA